MLVLSRKEGQRIQIGNDTTITITKIKGSVVRIGIDAPNHVSVMRSELLDDDELAAKQAPVLLAS
jgi:carbon storage regulator